MTVMLKTPFSSFPSWGLRREAIFIIPIQIQYDTMTAISLQQISNISMFKQDLSIFTRLVWCAINTCTCNNFPAFLWASKRAPRKSRDKWGWSLKEDFLNNLEYRRYPTVSNQWQTSTAELCERYKRHVINSKAFNNGWGKTSLKAIYSLRRQACE